MKAEDEQKLQWLTGSVCHLGRWLVHEALAREHEFVALCEILNQSTCVGSGIDGGRERETVNALVRFHVVPRSICFLKLVD